MSSVVRTTVTCLELAWSNTVIPASVPAQAFSCRSTGITVLGIDEQALVV